MTEKCSVAGCDRPVAMVADDGSGIAYCATHWNDDGYSDDAAGVRRQLSDALDALAFANRTIEALRRDVDAQKRRAAALLATLEKSADNRRREAAALFAGLAVDILDGEIDRNQALESATYTLKEWNRNDETANTD